MNLYILLTQSPPPCSPVPLLSPRCYLGLLGGKLTAAVLLCPAHTAPTLCPLPCLVSLPLVAQAGAEMLVLMTVGNTNQRGDFFLFSFLPLDLLALLYLSTSSQHIFCFLSVCAAGWGENLFLASRRGAGMQQHCTATLRGAGLGAEPGGERLLVYEHGWH